MELNSINKKGRWEQIAQDLNENFESIGAAVEQVKNTTSRNKGYFVSLDALNAQVTRPTVGDKAYVGSGSSYTVYQYTSSGWTNTGTASGNEVPNLDNYYTEDEADQIFLGYTREAEEIEAIAPTLVTEALRKTPQTLADSEKIIARGNIGAASAADVTNLITKVDTNKTETDTKLTELASNLSVGLQKITGKIEKEFYLEIGETPSKKTITPCYFKSGDRIIGRSSVGSAVFDETEDKSLNVTFFAADGTTKIISHSVLNEYTFNLTDDAYYYAVYAYKIATAGTVTVNLESTESLESVIEKVNNQENVVNPSIFDQIKNISFKSGEKVSSVNISSELKKGSNSLVTSDSVFEGLENAATKDDMYRWENIGIVSRYITLSTTEHSASKDQFYLPMPLGQYILKVDTVSAVLGENPSVTFRLYNEGEQTYYTSLVIGEEKRISTSGSQYGDKVGLYVYPVETFGDIVLTIKKVSNIPEDIERAKTDLTNINADLNDIKADLGESEIEKIYEDTLFPVSEDSIGIAARAGQTLKVIASTTGTVGGGWSVYGLKADGTTTRIMRYYNVGERTGEITEDYVDLLLNISGENNGTATFKFWVENWRKKVDDSINSIPTLEKDITDLKELIEDKTLYPEYFEENVNNVTSAAIKDIANVGINGDNFIFITDIHWSANSKHSLAIIKDICQKMSISSVFFGGDAIDGYADINKAIADFNAIAIELKQTNTRVACILGNHDWNSQSGGTKFDNDGGTFYAILQKQSDFDVVYGDVAYFYYDNPTTKTRYICLDTGPGRSINNTQANWLREIITSTNDSTHIIIVMHSYIDSSSFYEGDVWAGYDETISKAGTTVNTIISEFNDSKLIEAVFAGHSHLDYNGVTDSMVPVVMTDCDSRRTLMWEATVGTITEQSFDVVSIDYSKKMIISRRVGRGKSRIMHYTNYSLNVGGTLDISNLISIEPTSYSVRDNMVCRYIDANTVPNRIVFYNENATIDSNGVVTAVKEGYITVVAENDYIIETFNIKITV